MFFVLKINLCFRENTPENKTVKVANMKIVVNRAHLTVWPYLKTAKRKKL
jgi:hypothetical protein